MELFSLELRTEPEPEFGFFTTARAYTYACLFIYLQLTVFFISITNNKHVCFCLSFSFLIWISGKFLANGPFALKTRFVHPNTSFLLDFREGKNVHNIYQYVFHDLFLQLVLLTLLLPFLFSAPAVRWLKVKSEKTWNHTKSTLLVYVQVSCLLNTLLVLELKVAKLSFIFHFIYFL